MGNIQTWGRGVDCSLSGLFSSAAMRPMSDSPRTADIALAEAIHPAHRNRELTITVEERIAGTFDSGVECPEPTVLEIAI